MYTIYTKDNCSFCVKAKSVLDSHGLPYLEVHLDQGQEKTQGKQYISREQLLTLIPDARTMPQIMKDGFKLGGYSELVAHLQLKSQ